MSDGGGRNDRKARDGRDRRDGRRGPNEHGFVLDVFGEDTATVRRFVLGPGRHRVGARAGTEVRLTETGVSREHATIEVLPTGGAVIVDHGSKNGTTVDGRKIEAIAVTGPTPITFGPVRTFFYPSEPQRDRALLAPNDFARGVPPREHRGHGELSAGASTLDDGVLERWAAASREPLVRLVRGEIDLVVAASELAARWLAAGLASRVEFLRATDSVRAVAEGPAVFAAAASRERSNEAVANVAAVTVDGPAGWSLLLRGARQEVLSRLRSSFELVLEILAAAQRRTEAAAIPGVGRRGEAASERAPVVQALGREMSKLYRAVSRVARGEVPVLILGESGVGKELLARHVHTTSRRAAGPFLAINCAALPRELLEAELFGIERGVATGVEARPGLLERANGGTVFLDELGDMAAETQAKILRVLENTSLYRVGGRAPIAVDVRFVAATNRDVFEMVERDLFRRDLYYRLAAFEVRIPPLRERREEIPALVGHFLAREAGKRQIIPAGVTRAALGALIAYAWPGNVRELENEISRGVLLLEPGTALDLSMLSPKLRRDEPRSRSLTLAEVVARAEREAFEVALAAARGDARQAMELLGLPRTTYYRKLRELGLDDEIEPRTD